MTHRPTPLPAPRPHADELSGVDYDAIPGVAETRAIRALTPEQAVIARLTGVSPDVLLRAIQHHAREKAIKAANLTLYAAAPAMLAALQRAHDFIRNGIEMGYIRMPDPGTPDSAHDTPTAIKAAIAAATGTKGSD